MNFLNKYKNVIISRAKATKDGHVLVDRAKSIVKKGMSFYEGAPVILTAGIPSRRLILLGT